MISIIMPVFNAKKYIRATLDSIVNQTYQDFELLLIDDGASDGTEAVCKEYADKYENVYYYKGEGRGCCAARNYGLNIARGEYIAFSDHDDIYDSRYLEIMLDFMNKNDVDFVKCGVEFINEMETDTDRYIGSFSEGCLSRRELIPKLMFFSAAYYEVWNCIFKASFIKKCGIRFDENVKYGQEDFIFNIELVPYIKKVGFVKECLYKHYKRAGQSTSAQFHPERVRDISAYALKEADILKDYQELLPKGWMTIINAQNIIGVIRYCMNSNLPYKESVQYVDDYITNTRETFCKTFFMSGRRIKYSVVSFLARKGIYWPIYKLCNSHGK